MKVMLARLLMSASPRPVTTSTYRRFRASSAAAFRGMGAPTVVIAVRRQTTTNPPLISPDLGRQVTMTLKVYLWDATVPMGSFQEGGTQSHVTDIASSEDVPRVGSVVVGLEYEDWTAELIVRTLGVVKSKSIVSTGRSRFRVEQLLVLSNPRRFEDAMEAMGPAAQKRAKRSGLPVDASPVVLTPTVAKEILEALKTDGAVAEWLRQLQSVPQKMSERTLAVVQESRDAIAIAMRIADPRMRYDGDPLLKHARGAVSDDVITAVIDDAHLVDSEEDLIPEELRRFRSDTQRDQPSAHMARLRGRGYDLLVFNVNKKPLEVVLGVDLIYWDLDRNSFTMLQYKRLERKRLKDGNQSGWRYVRKKDITEQLGLMQNYRLRGTEASESKNWRMTSPYWFKFVRRDAAKYDDGELLRGMYVPADYLRLACADGSLETGSKGGFQVTYDNTTYITRDVFAELISRGAIGTAGLQSNDMKRIVENVASVDRNMIIAVKKKWDESTTGEDVSGPVLPPEADDDEEPFPETSRTGWQTLT